MKNSLKLVIGFFIVVSVIGLIFALKPKNENKNQSNSRDPGIETATQNDTEADSDNKYVIFSQGILENYKNERRLLYFYANWCPTCRPVDDELNANPGKIPDGVVIIRINYNDTDTDSDERALAKKYGVTYQHTFVEIDSEGNVLQIWNGGGVGEILERLE